MWIKKIKNKLIIIWTLFLFSMSGSFVLLSTNDIKLTSFWKISKVWSLSPKAFAEDDDEDEDGYKYLRWSSWVSTTTQASGVTTWASWTWTKTTPISPTSTQTSTTSWASSVANNTEPKTTPVKEVQVTTQNIKQTNIQPKPTIVPVNTQNSKPQYIQPQSTVAPVQTEKKYIDWSYTWIGSYYFPWSQFDYTVEIVIKDWKIQSWVWKEFMAIKSAWFNKSNWDIILKRLVDWQEIAINTVSWATWVSNALRSAISDALNKAKSNGNSSVSANKPSTNNTTAQTKKNVPKPNVTPVTKSTTPIAPITAKPAPVITPNPTPQTTTSTTTKAS